MTAKRRGGRPPDLAKRAEAARLRGEGKTYRQVADAMGICVARAHQLLNPKKSLASTVNVQ